jgi:hypothetical protein
MGMHGGAGLAAALLVSGMGTPSRRADQGAIVERQKFSALLKMLRAGLT